MTALCTGGCGKPVTDEGKICPSCWYETGENDPIQTPPASDFALRMEIHNASFRLCFGTKAERDEAIEKLSQLIAQITRPSGLSTKDKE